MKKILLIFVGVFMLSFVYSCKKEEVPPPNPPANVNSIPVVGPFVG